MKEKLRNKKVVYTIIGIVSILLVALAVTYAYWLVTKTQTGENEITAGCLDIAISGEKNDIGLTNQFPMSDEDGMKLVPYEFTVTNNCNTSVDYQVALEATGDSSNALKGTSLKVALNDSAKLYSAYPSVETTIEGAYESRVLGYSKLAGAGSEGSSDTYSLRIWIDADAPISEMSKTFKSRISVTVGQGIESPYEEGTLAYDILAKFGGYNAVREVDKNEYDHRIIVSGSVSFGTNSYYYGTEYAIDLDTGKYTLSGELIQATVDECRDGTKKCGKYTVKSTSPTGESKTVYEIVDFKSSGSYLIANIIEYNTMFNSTPTSTVAEIYKTEDDLGVSYYYRGAPTNNYVEFGTYAEDTTISSNYHGTVVSNIKAGDPMYWRIVRINGDGTIRLVYDGVEKSGNGTAHTATILSSPFNENSDNVKYVGYTYDDGAGVQVDSTIKGALDAWYDKHLETTYGTYIADSIFCNDKENANGDNLFASYERMFLSDAPASPSLKCAQKEDRYTVNNTTIGNGFLSNPIGMLTADEVIFAGGGINRGNQDFYLYLPVSFWTMTPFQFSTGATISSINTGGMSAGSLVSITSYEVRPVINLKANVEFTGSGTIDDPYKIVME